MSDKAHKIISVALAAIVGLSTLAMTPGVGPAAGHPQIEMWLKFLAGIAGFLGTLFIKPAANSGSGSSGGTVTKLTAMLLVVCFFATGCAGWPVFERCATRQAPRAAQSLLVSILTIAAQPRDYTSDLQALASGLAESNLVGCVVAALIADYENSPKMSTLVAHLREYLSTHPVSSLRCMNLHA